MTADNKKSFLLLSLKGASQFKLLILQRLRLETDYLTAAQLQICPFICRKRRINRSQDSLHFSNEPFFSSSLDFRTITLKNKSLLLREAKIQPNHMWLLVSVTVTALAAGMPGCHSRLYHWFFSPPSVD